MIDPLYLHRGLSAMARAWRANAMAGHPGAALIAGHCFADAHRDLDDRVYAGIEGELDRIISGEELWFDPAATGMTAVEFFAPFPEAPSHPERAETIADALSGNISALRQSGHNVIFAALALQALGEHPQFATDEIVAGICQFIKAFDGEHPGRLYLGVERGWVRGDQVSPPEDHTPPYVDEQAMAEAVADELIDTAAEKRQGVGGLWHIINHTAALLDLARLGYADLAQRGYAAHHQHHRLWCMLPDLTAELGPMAKAAHDPRTPEYWTRPLRRDNALLAHRIKTLYGFHTMVGLVEDDATRRRAEEAFLHLMA